MSCTYEDSLCKHILQSICGSISKHFPNIEIAPMQGPVDIYKENAWAAMTVRGRNETELTDIAIADIEAVIARGPQVLPHTLIWRPYRLEPRGDWLALRYSRGILLSICLPY